MPQSPAIETIAREIRRLSYREMTQLAEKLQMDLSGLDSLEHGPRTQAVATCLVDWADATLGHSDVPEGMPVPRHMPPVTIDEEARD